MERKCACYVNAVGHIISHKHKGEGMEEKVVVEFINDMKQERKSDKFYIHFHDYSTYRDRCWYKSI